MLQHLKRWPRWLHILTIVFLLAWILWLLPVLITLAQCGAATEAGQSCQTIAWGSLVSALNTTILLLAGWLVFFLCALEKGRKTNDWKRWLLLGILCGGVVALVGSVMMVPLITSAGMSLRSLSLALINLCIYGFLLSIWIVFPIHWAVRFLRQPRPSAALRGAVLGGALGITYSILTLVVIPFASIFASVTFRLNLNGGPLRLLGYVQPLIFYVLPQGVLQATPFSPAFDATAGLFRQLFSLPIFLFFNGVADVVILLVLGALIGWIAGKVKKAS